MNLCDNKVRTSSHTLTSLLLPSWRELAVVVTAFPLKGSAFWVIPVIIAGVVPGVVPGVVTEGGVPQLVPDGLVPILVISIHFPANSVFVLPCSRAVRNLGAGLRSDLTTRLKQLSMRFNAKSGIGVIQTKVVRDVENSELTLLHSAGPIISAFGILIGAGVTLAIQVPAFLVVAAPSTAWLERWIRQRTDNRNDPFARDVKRLSSSVSEMASLQTLIVIRPLGSASASLTHTPPITPGRVLLLSTYFVTITSSIVGLLKLASLATNGRESLRSIRERLLEPDCEYNDDKSAVSAAVRGSMVFDYVDFQHESSTRAAIRSLDPPVSSGETVAFVGSSRSSKSTVLILAFGFLYPTAGRGLLDGRDLRDLHLRTVRQFASVVQPDSVLFSGRVRDPSLTALIKCRTMSCTRRFVRRLPQTLCNTSPRAGALSLESGARCYPADRVTASQSRGRSSETRASSFSMR